jgi:hypothetical protein
MMIRSAVILATVLCVASVTQLGAQQVSAPVAPAVAAAVPASVDTTTAQPGPRLSPEWRPVEPTLATSNSAARMASSDSHTITVTTLALVLIVIIVVLLVVK